MRFFSFLRLSAMALLFVPSLAAWVSGQQLQHAFDSAIEEMMAEAATPEEYAALEELSRAGLRSVSGMLNNITWGPTTCAGMMNGLVVGADSDGAGANAISLASAATGAEVFNPLVPPLTVVNNQQLVPNANPRTIVNPLTGVMPLAIVTGQNKALAVSINAQSSAIATRLSPWKKPPYNVGGARANAAASVFMVNQDTSVLMTAAPDLSTLYPLHTTVATQLTAKIYALAATKKAVVYNAGGKSAPFIFAAVSSDATDFSSSSLSSNNVGIVPVLVNTNKKQLQPLAANNFAVRGTGNVATPISMVPGGQVAIKAATSLLPGAGIDMWWDDNTKRLYVALSGLQTGGTAGAGAVGLLVGKISKAGSGALTLQSALPLNSALLSNAQNAPYVIAGLYNTTAGQSIINVYKVRTMRTSTGRDYVIVIGGVANSSTAGDVAENTWVTAMPLVSAGPNAGKIGTVNPINQALPFVPVAAASDLVQVTRNVPSNVSPNTLGAIVGFNPMLISQNTSQTINDMHIVGDTVYVSVAGTRNASHNHDAGIFASRALFDENGTIRRWTPWQRVMGSIDGVYGFGYDSYGQIFDYVTTTDGLTTGNPVTDAINTVKATQWNDGSSPSTTSGSSNNPLSTVLNNAGFVTDGGVYSLFNFSGATPGFAAPVNGYDAFSMMIATGYGQVALVQTGNLDTPGLSPSEGEGEGEESGTVFNPTMDFDRKNVFVLPVPKAMGPILAAEVSRIPITAIVSSNQGWAFVGGQGGLAVLCDQNGNGWELGDGSSAQGLKSLMRDAFPGSGFAFKQLVVQGTRGRFNPFQDVRKLFAVGKNSQLYVLTRTALYRITLVQADIASGAISSVNIATVIDLLADNSPTNNLNVYSNAAMTNLSGGIVNNTVISTLSNHDQLFDMIVLESVSQSIFLNPNGEIIGQPLTVIALATSQGVLQSGLIASNFTMLRSPGNSGFRPFFKYLPAQDGVTDLRLGPALRFDVVSAVRGGVLSAIKSAGMGGQTGLIADSNVYVTAFDRMKESLNVYRFNVALGASLPTTFMQVFKEPYQYANGNRTDYFYRIGQVNPNTAHQLMLQGPADFVGLNITYGTDNSSFVQAVPMVPNPSVFTSAHQKNSAINLNIPVNVPLPIDGIQVLNTASGAQYIAGQFGLLVNQ